MVTKKKAAPAQKRTNRPAPTATRPPLIAERAKRRPYPYDDEKVNIIGAIALVAILLACAAAAYWLF